MSSKFYYVVDESNRYSDKVVEITKEGHVFLAFADDGGVYNCVIYDSNTQFRAYLKFINNQWNNDVIPLK